MLHDAHGSSGEFWIVLFQIWSSWLRIGPVNMLRAFGFLVSKDVSRGAGQSNAPFAADQRRGSHHTGGEKPRCRNVLAGFIRRSTPS